MQLKFLTRSRASWNIKLSPWIKRATLLTSNLGILATHWNYCLTRSSESFNRINRILKYYKCIMFNRICNLNFTFSMVNPLFKYCICETYKNKQVETDSAGNKKSHMPPKYLQHSRRYCPAIPLRHMRT